MHWEVALLGALAPSDFTPDGTMGPLLSRVLLYGLFLLGPLVLIALALLRSLPHRRRATAAEAAYREEAPLQPGLTTLFGTVEELPPGAEHAVRVEIVQDGIDVSESSGAWSHRWVEKDRLVEVHPFYLRHASGRRVLVEPHREVLLVDEMDGVIRVNLCERVRVAELVPGEEVFAHGELQETPDPAGEAPGGAYREAPRGLALRPPRDGRMLLSTEPLGERFMRQARLHTGFALAMGVALVLFHLVLAPYHLRAVGGSTVVGEVVKMHHHRTREGDMHFEVGVSLPGGALVEDHVARGLYLALEEGAAVPVRRSPVLPSYLSQVGPRATAHVAYGIVAGVLWLVLLLTYIYHARSGARWFEGLLVESGPGRLEETLEGGEAGPSTTSAASSR